MADPDYTTLGKVTWASSDEDSGPDVGMMLGLGDGKSMWVGEITRAAWKEAEADVKSLGDDFGWWLGIYHPEFEPMAKFADAQSAREFFDAIEATVRLAGKAALDG